MEIKNKEDFLSWLNSLRKLDEYLKEVKGTSYERSLEYEETVKFREELLQALNKFFSIRPDLGDMKEIQYLRSRKY